MMQRLIWFGVFGCAWGCAKPIAAVSGLMDAEGDGPIDSGTVPDVPDTDEDDDEDDDSSVPTETVPMTREGMTAHLEALMAIAEAHDGNRAAGTEGYDASVAYVSEQLIAAGYAVALHEFDVDREVWNSPPSVTAGREMVMEEDFYPFSYTGSGIVTALPEMVDVVIPPPEGENTTDSGCESSDFAEFTSGRIAVVQRGTCTFQTKVDNAVAAGASGVLVFNEGQPGRRDLFAGTLDEGSDNPIPVFALTYDAGVEISELSAGVDVTMVADISRIAVPSVNVIAETSGDSDRAIVVGAHLDSVEAGPGINDNGSGVAMILEMATQIAESDWEPTNQIRFAFWGAEELGLLGSIDYVFSMTDDERGRVLANLNFDMVASPNPARMVYDGSGSLGGEGGPYGSARIEEIFTDWFDAYGLAYQETPFDGRSDYGPFIWTGIPAGGLFTGAEAIKTPGEAEEFGGTAMAAYDPCYHQGCDTLDNLDFDVLDELAGAAMNSVVNLGELDGPLTDGPAGPPIADAERTWLQPDWVPTSCGDGPTIWRR